MLSSIAGVPSAFVLFIFIGVNLSILTQIFILSISFVFIFIVGYLKEDSEITRFKKMLGHVH